MHILQKPEKHASLHALKSAMSAVDTYFGSLFSDQWHYSIYTYKATGRLERRNEANLPLFDFSLFKRFSNEKVLDN